MAKYRGFFSAAHAVTWQEFAIGSIIGGILLGIGWSLGSILIKGVIKKYAPQHSFLAEGDF